jgi:integrase
MPIYRRQGSPYWWVRVSISGEKIRRSAETTDRDEAKAFEARLKADLLDEAPVRRKGYTWDQAALRFVEDRQQKRSIDTDLTILRWLQPHLSGLLLVDISQDKLDEVRHLKASETSMSRADRVMALVNSILRAAQARGWMRKAPKVTMFRPEPADFRWLTREQFDALARELPPHLEAMARFAVATGLRRGNVTGLLWRDVDLERATVRVWRSQAKAKKSIAVPLNADAVAVLRAQPKGTHVFTYQGEPVYQVATKAWRAAVARAGIEPGFRFHDLRHTWASWHVQAGTPLTALMELGGWASLEMVQRYAHFGSRHLADYAANVSLQRAQQKGTPKKRAATEKKKAA